MADAANALVQGPCSVFCDDADISEDVICRVDGSGDLSGATVAQVNEIRAAATDVVWALLARPVMGICSATIYPCRRENIWRWWNPASQESPYGPRAGCVNCGNREGIQLDQPVVDITEVVVDGDVLAASEYLLVDHAWLVRASGGSWPAGAIDDYADFSISYTFGSAVPTIVRKATVEVAYQMWKERPGAGREVPANATSVSRQGMTFTPDRDNDRIREMGPSLPALMQALSIYNPMGERFPTAVWSPDESHHSRTVRSFS